MSKLLVSCDEYAYHLNGSYYLSEFGTALSHRYLNVFQEIRLAVRTRDIDSESELKGKILKIKDNRIEIYPLPFFQGPRQYAREFFRIKKSLNKVTYGCDAAVFRLPSTVAYASHISRIGITNF